MSVTEYLLIDFENVRPAGIPAIHENQNVFIFAGDNQNKIDYDLVRATQPYGNRVQWIKIKGSGRNALDFHISFYLGKLSAIHKQASFFILSKDKGFDPLVRYLEKSGIQCKRITQLQDFITGKKEVDDDSIFAKILRMLLKIDLTRRPKRIRTLKAFIGSRNKMDSVKVDKIIKRLADEKIIILNEEKVSYPAGQK
jgi:hypothetical protein